MKLKLKKIKIEDIKKFVQSIQIDSVTAVVLITLIVLLINVLGQRLFFRLDLTETKIYSLSDGTEAIINDLEVPVDMNIFISDNIPPGFNSLSQNIEDLLQEYDQLSNGNLNIVFKNSEDTTFETEAKAAGLPEIPFGERTEDKVEIAQGYFGASISSEYGQEIVSFSTGIDDLEYEISSKIYKLSQTDKPTIGFLINNGEKSTGGLYSYISEALRREYTVEAVDVSEGKPIDPEKVSVLIVAGPTEAMSKRTLFELEQYLLQGGRAVFLVENYTNNFETLLLAKNENNINELLSYFSVSVEQAVILDESFTPIPSGFLPIAYPYWMQVLKENINANIPVLNKLESTTLFWASPIIYSDDYKVTDLLKTSKDAWSISGDSINIDIDQYLTPQERSQYSTAILVEGSHESNFKGDGIPALPGKKTKDQRKTKDKRSNSTDDLKFVVITDSDFISNEFIDVNQQGATFFINLVSWLSNNEALIDIRAKNIPARPLDVTDNSEKSLIRVLNIFGTPVLVISAGVVYSFKRKNKPSIL